MNTKLTSDQLYENEEDLVVLLRKHGYGVVEGAEAVREKIREIGLPSK